MLKLNRVVDQNSLSKTKTSKYVRMSLLLVLLVTFRSYFLLLEIIVVRNDEFVVIDLPFDRLERLHITLGVLGVVKVFDKLLLFECELFVEAFDVPCFVCHVVLER